MTALERLVTQTKQMVVGNFLTGMASQGVLSLTSFVVGAIAARFALKTEYAIYVVAFSVLGIATNFQNALATTPMTVMMNDKSERDRTTFVSGLATAQLVLLILVAVVAGLLLSLVPGIVGASRWTDAFPMVFSASLFFWLCREFVRTLRLSELRMRSVVMMDVTSLLATLGIIAYMVFLEKITASSALAALGGGTLAASFIGLVLPGRRITFRWTRIREAYTSTWPYAKWAIIGVVAGIVQSRAYIYITSTELGLLALANLAAARLLLLPFDVFTTASVRIVVAKGSSILSKGSLRSLKRFVLAVAFFMVLAWAAYSVLLATTYPYAIKLLGAKYNGIASLLPYWALCFLIMSIRFPIKNALIVVKKFRIVTRNDLISGFLTLVLSLLLVHLIGVSGVIMGLASGEAVLLGLSAYELFWRRGLRRQSGHLAGLQDEVEEAQAKSDVAGESG